MAAALRDFRILLVDDDPNLLADMARFNSSPLSIRARRTTLDLSLREWDCDVIIINLDLPGSIRAIEDISRRQPHKTVLAIASRGIEGGTLEYALLQAELRGASASAPKPISGRELLAAALEASERDKGRKPVTQSIQEELRAPLLRDHISA